MTEPDRYGEEIRRALSAAAELVVPAGDGLDIIRKRAARRPPMLAWLLAYVSYLPRQLITRVRVVASEVAVMAKGESDLLPRMWARRRPRAGHARSAQAWLRPALAGAAALLLVLGVMLAVPKLRQTITNQANTGTSGGPGGGAGASGQVYGNGTQSPGASGSSTAGFQSSSGLPPMMASGPMPRGPLYLMLPGGGGGTVPNPCVSSTSSYAPSSSGTTPATDTSSAGNPGTAPGGGGVNAGAPNDSAGQQNGGYAHGGVPNCGPSGTSTPTTPPTSTPPTSTPPTSTPPTSTPPTSPPPTSPSSPTSPPPTSTSAFPTEGSSAATPAPTITSSGS